MRHMDEAKLIDISRQNIPYEHSYETPSWVGVTNPNDPLPILPIEETGKWVILASDLSDWEKVCQGIAAHRFYSEAKIAVRTNSNGENPICVYASIADIDTLMASIRDAGIETPMIWKFDVDTADGLYGPGSFAYRCESGSRSKLPNLYYCGRGKNRQEN